MKTDNLWPKFERATELNDLIVEAVEQRIPGEYRLDLSEYLRIAAEFQASGVSPFMIVGYRMQCLERELAETDRVFSANFAGRTQRKQLELLRKSLAKCAEASDKMRKQIERRAI